MDLYCQLSNNMEEIVNLFQSRMDGFDAALEGRALKGDSVELTQLATDYNAFKEVMWKTLSLYKQQLELLSTVCDRHEVQLRRQILLFHGVKEKHDEIPENAVLEIVRDRLKLSACDASMIDVCHRLGIRKEKPRPILIRFTTIKTRATVWNAKSALRGTGVTISEFLTKPRQEVFTEARKHFGLQQCWTSDGVITVVLADKSRKRITSMSELRVLMQTLPPQCTQEKPSRPRRQIKNNPK